MVKIGKNNLLGGAPLLDDSNSFGIMRKLVLKNREHCALEVAVDIRLERC